MFHRSLSKFRNLMISSFLLTLVGCGDGKPGMFSANGYKVGKGKVWYKTSTGMAFHVTEVLGADAKTFAVRELSSKSYPGATAFYGMDQSSVFWGSGKIEGADLASFEYICNNYSKDREMNEVENADQKTYQILEHGYSRDAHNVYQGGVHMDGVNPAIFWVLTEHYSQDDRHCYYFMTPLPNADPVTFRIIDEFYAKDARHVFTLDKVIEGADPSTFRVLNGPAGCACDARYAYTMEKRIEGVDPKRFPATGGCKSCDESGVTF